AGRGEKNGSVPAGVGACGGTAGPTRGWMGAHAPITTVFVPGTKSSGGMMRLSSFDPIAALAAARPLVATAGERVQRPQGAELAVDFEPSAMGLTPPSCSAEAESTCVPRTNAGCLSSEFISARPPERGDLVGAMDSRISTLYAQE